MPDIVQLPAVLANQIAAGEVVERPASVVKELLENAVDAGAGRVRVDVADGGIGLIRVRDDGHGIAAGQLGLALTRHATSKLTRFEELACIGTLGFRGEALPSIAAVARLRLVSRTADADCAWQVEVDGGVFEGQAVPTSGPPGSSVEVRDLFFNTPARRRFLRTARTEYLHVEEVVRRMALARPQLALELWRDGKRQLQAGPAPAELADGEPARRRLGQLTDTGFARTARWFDERSGSWRCCGWVSSGGDGRAHADLQQVCVNGRVVRDPLLRHALRAAFDGLVEAGRYPAYVVHLQIGHDELDVNVHPTKHELRFREARGVHDFVLSVVRRAVCAGQGELLTPAADDVRATAAALQPAAAAARPAQSGAAAPGYRPAPLRARPPASSGAWRDYTRLAGTAVAEAAGTAAWLRLGPRFAVLADGGEARLLDLAALSRQVVSAALQRGAAQLPLSPLLIPAVHALDEARAERLQSLADVLAGAGLQVRRSAPGELLLLEVPACLDHVPAPALWSALVGWATAADGRASAPALAAALAASAGATVALAELDDGRARRWWEQAREAADGERLVRILDDAALERLFAAG